MQSLTGSRPGLFLHKLNDGNDALYQITAQQPIILPTKSEYTVTISTDFLKRNRSDQLPQLF